MKIGFALRRLAAGLLVCLAVVSNGHADTRLRGGWLLVATPSLGDPSFREAVILLVRHGADGGFGFVLNRPFGSGPLGVLLDGLGVEHDADADARVQLFLGGPVETDLGFVVHTADFQGASTRPIPGTGLAFSTEAALLADIADGRGPARHRVFLGYTGWGPGQLEAELDRGDWQLAPTRIEDVFTADPTRLWRTLRRRAGTPL